MWTGNVSQKKFQRIFDMGKVYLVGAGPGDPDLITVKGYNLIKNCDCLIYDRLAGDDLIRSASKDCELVYVGKQPGCHYKKQEEINEILIKNAEKYETIVRLKGGDSFVFGRGGEEIEALEKMNIPYEVVPGITSAIAVPECAGIPVTHREIARSFHVITGHTNAPQNNIEKNDDSSLYGIDFEKIAGYEGTIVFLMGLSNLSTITQKLIENGKNPSTSVAVISEGTTIYEKEIRGNLSDISKKVKEENISSPAVIVVGETAGKHYRYEKNRSGKNVYEHADGLDSVSGKIKMRVGVVATPSLFQRLYSAFTKEGITTALLCDMDVVPDKFGTEQIGQLIDNDDEKHNITGYSWILFTSQNAVRLFFELYKKKNADLRKLSAVKFGALGEGTRQVLLQYGFKADFVPTKYTIRNFCEEFERIVTDNDNVLIPRAEQGSDELIECKNRWKGKSDVVVLYDVKGRGTQHIKRIEEFTHIVFSSASGVTAFFEEMEKNKKTFSHNIKTVCIGDVTAAKLKKYGVESDLIASVFDVNGLLEAVRDG